MMRDIKCKYKTSDGWSIKIYIDSCLASGVLDRNGQEIYFGDFIGNPKGDIVSRLGKSAEYFLVGFDSGAFMAGRRRECPTSMDTYLWLIAPEMEVIGNRYDNPEMLIAKGWAKEDMPKAVFSLGSITKGCELNKDGNIHCPLCNEQAARCGGEIKLTDRCKCGAEVIDI